MQNEYNYEKHKVKNGNQITMQIIDLFNFTNNKSTKNKKHKLINLTQNYYHHKTQEIMV